MWRPPIVPASYVKVVQACRPVGMGPHSPGLLSSCLRVWENGRARPPALTHLLQGSAAYQQCHPYLITDCWLRVYSKNTVPGHIRAQPCSAGQTSDGVAKLQLRRTYSVSRLPMLVHSGGILPVLWKHNSEDRVLQSVKAPWRLRGRSVPQR